MTANNLILTSPYTETNAEVIEKALYCLKHGELESVENWLKVLTERLTDKISANAMTDEQILSIAEPHFSVEESRYGKEFNPHPQYHGSDLSVVLFARNLLAAFGGNA
ncbi:hypothetical protein [Burkholderia latens]|uniref:hypothetical protein n=1 Tax=Burkholderia latens TaxID=488446 RepID=UPI001589AD87|nr:hypothetical protein [Burkholderia latens]